MSNENVELVRSFYRPASLSRFIDLLDEDVGFDFSAYPVPGRAVLRGKEAAIDWCRSWWGTWDEYILEPTRSAAGGAGTAEWPQWQGSYVLLERHGPSLRVSETAVALRLAGPSQRCELDQGRKFRRRIAVRAIRTRRRSRRMIVQVVKYKSGLSDDDVRRVIAERAPRYEALPQLRQKLYIREPETGEYGGIYVWDDEESMRESASRISPRPSRTPTASRGSRGSRSSSSSRCCALKRASCPRSGA